MSVIKGICSAIKEDKVNKWLSDNSRRVKVSGNGLSNEYLELFERERCEAVRESVDACEYAGITNHIEDKQKLMSTSISDINK